MSLKTLRSEQLNTIWSCIFIVYTFFHSRGCENSNRILCAAAVDWKNIEHTLILRVNEWDEKSCLSVTNWGGKGENIEWGCSFSESC